MGDAVTLVPARHVPWLIPRGRDTVTLMGITHHTPLVICSPSGPLPGGLSHTKGSHHFFFSARRYKIFFKTCCSSIKVYSTKSSLQYDIHSVLPLTTLQKLGEEHSPHPDSLLLLSQAFLRSELLGTDMENTAYPLLILCHQSSLLRIP